jgi:hypothetical protein
VIAGMDAWKDADLPIWWRTRLGQRNYFGAGTSGIEKFRESIYKIDDFQTVG